MKLKKFIKKFISNYKGINISYFDDDDYYRIKDLYDLISTTVHFRDKYQNEFYTIITQIRIIDREYLIGLNSAIFSFNELFNSFEIEINGEWLPFGVTEK